MDSKTQEISTMPPGLKRDGEQARSERLTKRDDSAELVARLREMADYKYQTHTLHAPIVMTAAADRIEQLERAAVRPPREPTAFMAMKGARACDKWVSEGAAINIWMAMWDAA